jgi:hypothetical protein
MDVACATPKALLFFKIRSLSFFSAILAVCYFLIPMLVEGAYCDIFSVRISASSPLNIRVVSPMWIIFLHPTPPHYITVDCR